jgi:hypothetical protein
VAAAAAFSETPGNMAMCAQFQQLNLCAVVPQQQWSGEWTVSELSIWRSDGGAALGVSISTECGTCGYTDGRGAVCVECGGTGSDVG